MSYNHRHSDSSYNYLQVLLPLPNPLPCGWRWDKLEVQTITERGTCAICTVRCEDELKRIYIGSQGVSIKYSTLLGGA